MTEPNVLFWGCWGQGCAGHKAKWFMSKEPRKVFGKDTKYKLKVRMQEVSPVQEYKDVDLNGGSYEKAAISRLLTDGEVKHVVGKLKRF